MTDEEASERLAAIDKELAALNATPTGRLVEAMRRSDEVEAMRIDIQRVLAGGPLPHGWPNWYGPVLPQWMVQRRSARGTALPSDPFDDDGYIPPEHP